MKEHVKEKWKYPFRVIDVKARDAFQNKKATASMIACLHGFNYYSMRDALINKNMKRIECPRCSANQTW